MPIVSFKDSDKDYPVKMGQVLFDALEDHGVSLPHGCLSGSCGACRIKILAGSEILDRPGGVEADTINAVKNEQGITGEVRLSCRAKIVQDGHLKIENA